MVNMLREDIVLHFIIVKLNLTEITSVEDTFCSA